MGCACAGANAIDKNINELKEFDMPCDEDLKKSRDKEAVAMKQQKELQTAASKAEELIVTKKKDEKDACDAVANIGREIDVLERTKASQQEECTELRGAATKADNDCTQKTTEIQSKLTALGRDKATSEKNQASLEQELDAGRFVYYYWYGTNAGYYCKMTCNSNEYEQFPQLRGRYGGGYIKDGYYLGDRWINLNGKNAPAAPKIPILTRHVDSFQYAYFKEKVFTCTGNARTKKEEGVAELKRAIRGMVQQEKDLQRDISDLQALRTKAHDAVDKMNRKIQKSEEDITKKKHSQERERERVERLKQEQQEAIEAAPKAAAKLEEAKRQLASCEKEVLAKRAIVDKSNMFLKVQYKAFDKVHKHVDVQVSVQAVVQEIGSVIRIVATSGFDGLQDLLGKVEAHFELSQNRNIMEVFVANPSERTLSVVVSSTVKGKFKTKFGLGNTTIHFTRAKGKVFFLQAGNEETFQRMMRVNKEKAYQTMTKMCNRNSE